MTKNYYAMCFLNTVTQTVKGDWIPDDNTKKKLLNKLYAYMEPFENIGN